MNETNDETKYVVLAKCPFCGSVPSLNHSKEIKDGKSTITISIKCEHCGVEMSVSGDEDNISELISDILKRWETRDNPYGIDINDILSELRESQFVIAKSELSVDAVTSTINTLVDILADEDTNKEKLHDNPIGGGLFVVSSALKLKNIAETAAKNAFRPSKTMVFLQMLVLVGIIVFNMWYS
jgi:hypothetical protein